MAHTEQELSALTAKALRPIATELGITGTSRMVKADIVSAIVAAETARAELNAIIDGIPADLAASRAAIAIEDAHAEALKLDEKRTMARAFLSTPSGVRLTDDEIEAALQARQGANERLLELAATPLQQTPRKMPLTDVEREKTARYLAKDLTMMVNFGGTPPLQQGPKASGTVTGRITRHLAEEDAPMIEVERALKPEYFARQTRRGVETVVVERAHCGRVDYRIIDAKTGRRSSVYRMRELTFTAQYVKVPS